MRVPIRHPLPRFRTHVVELLEAVVGIAVLTLLRTLMLVVRGLALLFTAFAVLVVLAYLLYAGLSGS